MSRCFPFPPPGYEKKQPRPEDRDLLKEEKRKEKKHKREKDRDKKEGKEKRDKERSDGKHREKKDKKDKHRDKKEKRKDKKKDKDKDKEKSDISEEAKVAVLPGASSGQKLPSGDEHFKNESINSQEAKFHDQSHGQHAEKLFKSSLPTVETEESKFVQELARRIRDEQKGAVSLLAERFPVESKRDEKTNSIYINDSGNSAKEKVKNKERSIFSNKMDGQVRVEPRIDATAIHPSFSEMAKSKFHGLLPPLEENVENRREEKEKPKERRDDKPRDKKKKKEKDGRSHGKVKEKKKEEKGKDKSAHRKSEQDKSRDINKSNFVGLSTANHQVPLVLKEANAGVTEENHRKRKHIGTNGFLHESEARPDKLLRPSYSHHPTLNGKSLETHQKADMSSFNKQGVATGIQVINKEQSLNSTMKVSNKRGVSTDIEVGNMETHHKADMLSSSKQGVATNIHLINKERSLNGTIKLSNQHGVGIDIEMGNKERGVNGTIDLPNKHGVATDILVGNKERGVNGTIKGQPLTLSKPKTSALSKPKTSSMSPGADQIAEASKRPPRPDSKYLNQILSVPKMDEWYKHGVATDIEVGNKERRVNGTIEGQPLTMSKPETLAPSKPKTSSMSPGADQIAEASERPPHPDSIYLNQILSVPKMDEWSGFDDQEWLFGRKSTPVRKPEVCLDVVKDHRVWSEALQIDSADVCALPYVIPY